MKSMEKNKLLLYLFLMFSCSSNVPKEAPGIAVILNKVISNHAIESDKKVPPPTLIFLFNFTNKGQSHAYIEFPNRYDEETAFFRLKTTCPTDNTPVSLPLYQITQGKTLLAVDSSMIVAFRAYPDDINHIYLSCGDGLSVGQFLEHISRRGVLNYHGIEKQTRLESDNLDYISVDTFSLWIERKSYEKPHGDAIE